MLESSREEIMSNRNRVEPGFSNKNALAHFNAGKVLAGIRAGKFENLEEGYLKQSFSELRIAQGILNAENDRRFDYIQEIRLLEKKIRQAEKMTLSATAQNT